jgi:hypothetical protein
LRKTAHRRASINSLPNSFSGRHSPIYSAGVPPCMRQALRRFIQ